VRRDGAPAPASSFEDCVRIVGMANAAYFAADLFREAFGAPFPVPRRESGLAIETPPERWRQYVAFYRWSTTHVEPVAFVNFLRYGEAYLVGGLCARRNFYRRLPAAHWDACRTKGGIVQMLLEAGARELDDAAALFGYCGDAKSMRVAVRAGYQPTRHRYVIVNWLRELPDPGRRALEDQVEAVGPF
jgi:hypothetical protein